MLTKDIAICIRAVDYSETSQIVTFFARAAGKISAIAKGSKRPKSAFDGPIEIFSYGKIVFSDSNKEKLATLTEFESAYGGAGFTNLSKNLPALNSCLFAAELLNNLTHDYDPHPRLFDDFLQFLQNAQEAKNKSETLALLILFQLALLKEVGLRPVLNACANCQLPRLASRDAEASKNDFHTDWPQTYFSSSANGLICRDCESSFPDKVRLTKTAANCLSNLKLIAESQEKTLIEIEAVLVHHFTELLGRKPKMAKYVLK
ncbi:MAG: DNA repair protein RecO [Sedimentisphaerales bacterium]